MIFYLNRHERVQVIFTNNGSPDSCPYYDDLLKENLETGTSSYEFRVPSNHPKADEIEEGGFIVRKDPDNELVMFTVMQIEETHADMRDKYIYCENAGLELLNDIFRPVTHMSKNVNQILDIVLADTRWIRGETEYFGIDNFYFEEYQNVLAALQYVKEKFNGELNFRVEMKNGEIVARHVDLVEKRGTVTKKRFTYNKDINSIRRTIDMSDVVTALIGVGKADSKNNPTNFKGVGYYPSNGASFYKPRGQDWVGDPEALQRYGIKGKHLFGFYQYETSDATDLLNRTWKELQKRKNPKITYELDVSLLERLANLEHEAVRLGDTVYIIDETFSPALYLEARIIDLDTCFSDPSRDKCVLGNFKKAKSNITPEMRAIQYKLLQKESSWDDSAYKVEYLAPDGTDFADSGWKRIIVRVFLGSDDVTARIEADKFKWVKINQDGSHDLDWEDSQIGAGNVISVGAEVVGCTVRCEIDEGLTEPILFASEEDASSLATLQKTAPSGWTDFTTAVAQYAQVDYPRNDIYWSQSYVGPKNGSAISSYVVTRTDLTGQIKDRMWAINAGHGSQFGIEYIAGQMWIWSYYRDASNKWHIVKYKYQANKVLQWGDASILDLLSATKELRTNLDVRNGYVLFVAGTENPQFYVCKKSDVEQHIYKPIYSCLGSDIGYFGTRQTYQSACLDFPYVYMTSGDSIGNDLRCLYCFDVRSKSLIYRIVYYFDKGTIAEIGGQNEPEAVSYYYDASGKKRLVQGFAFGTSDKTNQLFKINEHVRGET